MRAVLALAFLLLAGCAAPSADRGGDGGQDGESGGLPSSGGSSGGSSGSPGSGPDPTQAPREPDTVFVLVVRHFTFERTSGEGQPAFSRGGHCGHGKWQPDPLSVTVYNWTDEGSSVTAGPSDVPWGFSGLLLTDWEVDGSGMMSTGSGNTVAGFDAASGALPLPRALGDGAVANLTAEGGVVHVDGQALRQGVAHPVRQTYEHTDTWRPTTYRVDERLDFTLQGLAAVHVEEMGHPCI